ncbi:SGNH/GDSL hydrolase family protein [Limnoglobus roseus]|uniref:G-D-S-L family lipolytic protein n=1 Tax=Limnoglobus roseus TaxID=2598579 RepID=A0A5C1AKF5_9BACT|nr:SGNH/GDSL hydrolase family protein [Limnoglobus roseus]QEL18496.1 G-D-S-L family lipolytic protein [Limnoglobus roseus]
MTPFPRRLFVSGIVFLALSSTLLAQTPGKKAELKKGVRVAVVGDSITEQKLYSRFLADYLTACYPDLDAHIVQFGWGGETADGFSKRMDNDLMPFKPDVVTLCYGMNDGGYSRFSKSTGDRYEKPLTEIVRKLKAANVTVVVGSPGAVDDYFYGRGPNQLEMTERSKMYNPTLAKLRDIAHKIADDAGMPFANVHDAMVDSMRKAQTADHLGPKYAVCGADGVHADANGQLIMTTAFLRAMKLDGDLGTVTIDFTGDSTAENGHKVASSDGGKVVVESSRLPFAFTGDARATSGTRSILPFLSFNAEFNRFTLKVKNAPAEKLKVTWGQESKTFTKDELQKGINLAEAFETTALSDAFAKIDTAVNHQQHFQTFMIKSVITNHRGLAGLAKEDPEIATALAKIQERLWAKEDANHAAVRALVPKTPVTHTILVEKAE